MFNSVVQIDKFFQTSVLFFKKKIPCASVRAAETMYASKVRRHFQAGS
jgi:hypothetical protein